MWTRWKLISAGAAIVIAAFIATLSVGINIGWSGGQYDAQSKGFAAQIEESADRHLSRCLSIGAAVEAQRNCAEAVLRGSRQAQREEAELVAQQQMAEWSRWLLLISVVQIPLSALGILGLLATIIQGREANAITREALVLENRAWLKVTLAGHEHLDGDPNEALVTCVYMRVANIGKGIAKEVRVRCKLCFSDDYEHDRLRLIGGTWSDEFEVKRSAVLSPGDELEITAEEVVLSDLAKLVRDAHQGDGEPGCAQLYLVVQAQYRPVLDPPTAPIRVSEETYQIVIIGNDHTEGRYRFVHSGFWEYEAERFVHGGGSRMT